MTATDRQREFAARMKKRKLVRIWLWVPKRFVGLVRRIERDLRDETKRERLRNRINEDVKKANANNLRSLFDDDQ